jgi:hypothetical protein
MFIEKTFAEDIRLQRSRTNTLRILFYKFLMPQASGRNYILINPEGLQVYKKIIAEDIRPRPVSHLFNSTIIL